MNITESLRSGTIEFRYTHGHRSGVPVFKYTTGAEPYWILFVRYLGSFCIMPQEYFCFIREFELTQFLLWPLEVSLTYGLQRLTIKCKLAGTCFSDIWIVIGVESPGSFFPIYNRPFQAPDFMVCVKISKVMSIAYTEPSVFFPEIFLDEETIPLKAFNISLVAGRFGVKKTFPHRIRPLK